jgi:hypothetical protein
MEHDAPALRREPLHHDGGACQRGMAAQRHLHGRREPAQAEVLAVGHQKGRLGQIVLRGDRLQDGIVGEALENHDRGRIAGEPAAGEGIDLIDRNVHRTPPGNCSMMQNHIDIQVNRYIVPDTIRALA